MQCDIGTSFALSSSSSSSPRKIQTVPPHIREADNYEKHYMPKLISIGPVHHNDPRLQRGEKYKHMWAEMFAKRNETNLQEFCRKVLSHIHDLREFFSWDEIKREDPYKDDVSAEMLAVDGCVVLQILEKGSLSKPEELNIKVYLLVLVRRDLLLLENQIPYEVLKLLVKDEYDLAICMHGFCVVRNMFSPLDSLNEDIFEKHFQVMKTSSPNNLLDFPRTIILCDDICAENQDEESEVYQVTKDEESQGHLVAQDEESQVYQVIIKDEESQGHPFAQDEETKIYQETKEEGSQDHLVAQDEESQGHPVAKDEESKVEVFWKNKLNMEIIGKTRYITYLSELFDEEQFTYRSIRELKAAAIRMKRQESVSLTNITFSSSIFGGKLYLPPLILDDSTVPTLLNLLAYEMCSDFKIFLKICSYVKLLDLLIDDPDYVKQLREAGILQNSLGSDKEVSELFNKIGSRLVHNHRLYSNIKIELEKHHKKRISVWIAEAYSTHCKSPWTIIALLAASALLVMTFLHTYKAFK